MDAVADEIKHLHEKGQPVLVGTVSVENSELVAEMLKKIGIPHNVLNAKYHEREAEIVAQAGRKGAVTIATNMAGRGTDIILGGNPEFLANDFLKKREINPDEATPEQFEEELEKAKRIVDAEHKEVVAAGGLHISAPNATNRAALTTSFADAPDDRAIRARPFRSLARRRFDADFRGRQSALDDGMARNGRRRRDRIENRFQTNRTRAKSGRSPQL
jgi:hypothetical protein